MCVSGTNFREWNELCCLIASCSLFPKENVLHNKRGHWHLADSALQKVSLLSSHFSLFSRKLTIFLTRDPVIFTCSQFSLICFKVCSVAVCNCFLLKQSTREQAHYCTSINSGHVILKNDTSINCNYLSLVSEYICDMQNVCFLGQLCLTTQTTRNILVLLLTLINI